MTTRSVLPASPASGFISELTSGAKKRPQNFFFKKKPPLAPTPTPYLALALALALPPPPTRPQNRTRLPPNPGLPRPPTRPQNRTCHQTCHRTRAPPVDRQTLPSRHTPYASGKNRFTVFLYSQPLDTFHA